MRCLYVAKSPNFTETHHQTKETADFTTILQFSVVQFLVVNTYTITIGYVFADIDATKYVLELVANPPMYRSTTEILALLIIRIFVYSAVCTEAFRTGAYMFSLGLIIIDRTRFVITTLFRTRKFSLYFNFYRQCLLIYKLLHTPIQIVVYMTLTVAFWFIVFLVWACIRFSPKTISTIVYTWQVISLVCVITAGFFLLSDFCNTMEIALQTVTIHKLRAKLVFCKSGTKCSKIVYYQARSVHPFRISYGFFGFLGEHFVGDFSTALSLRCFDVIMLF